MDIIHKEGGGCPAVSKVLSKLSDDKQFEYITSLHDKEVTISQQKKHQNQKLCAGLILIFNPTLFYPLLNIQSRWRGERGDPKLWTMSKAYQMFNRPGVAGAVLQTASSFTDSVGDPFVPNLQNTFIPKPLELGC